MPLHSCQRLSASGSGHACSQPEAASLLKAAGISCSRWAARAAHARLAPRLQQYADSGLCYVQLPDSQSSSRAAGAQRSSPEAHSGPTAGDSPPLGEDAVGWRVSLTSAGKAAELTARLGSVFVAVGTMAGCTCGPCPGPEQHSAAPVCVPKAAHAWAGVTHGLHCHQLTPGCCACSHWAALRWRGACVPLSQRLRRAPAPGAVRRWRG